MLEVKMWFSPIPTKTRPGTFILAWSLVSASPSMEPVGLENPR